MSRGGVGVKRSSATRPKGLNALCAGGDPWAPALSPRWSPPRRRGDSENSDPPSKGLNAFKLPWLTGDAVSAAPLFPPPALLEMLLAFAVEFEFAAAAAATGEISSGRMRRPRRLALPSDAGGSTAFGATPLAGVCKPMMAEGSSAGAPAWLPVGASAEYCAVALLC